MPERQSRRERREEERRQRRGDQRAARTLKALERNLNAQAASLLVESSEKPDFVATLKKFEDQNLALARASMRKIAAMDGYDTLTVDEQGSKSIEDMLRDGRTFSLGKATSCIAVGIVHDDVGIAGAHTNPITPEETAFALKRRSEFSGEHLTGLDYTIAHLNFTSRPQTRRDFATQTAQQAAEEFATLASGHIPQSGVQIVTYGMFFIPRDEVTQLEQLVVGIIAASPVMQTENSGLGLISVSSNLGKAGELFYGGRGHQRYPTPTFRETDPLLLLH